MATLDITESKTLLEFLLDLLNDKDALASFQRDPHAALEHAGLDHVCVDDIKELFPTVMEKIDAEKCAQYEDDCDDDHCWDEKPHCDDEHPTHCRPIDCDEDGRPAPHCSELDKVVTHLNYVTNNFTIDNSIHIDHVWTGGGDFILVNGDGNVFGDNNVIGDGNGDGNIGDDNVIGNDNGSGNAAVNVDLGLGDLPTSLPGFPALPSIPGVPALPESSEPEADPASALKTLSVASEQAPETSQAQQTTPEHHAPEHHAPEHHAPEPHITAVDGDGNVFGNGNVIGDGNGDGNIGDGNVVGDGNGSNNLALNVDLGHDAPVHEVEPVG